MREIYEWSVSKGVAADSLGPYRCGLQPAREYQKHDIVNIQTLQKRLLTPTYEHACEIRGVRRFSDEIVHGIFGAERSVELAGDGGKRPVRRFVCCTTAHV
jgi:hypothetical protein